MPARRFIVWEGREWTLNQLARTYHLPTSTLNHRLERFGATPTGIQRALATGLIDCRRAGLIGKSRSPCGIRVRFFCPADTSQPAGSDWNNTAPSVAR